MIRQASRYFGVFCRNFRRLGTNDGVIALCYVNKLQITQIDSGDKFMKEYGGALTLHGRGV